MHNKSWTKSFPSVPEVSFLIALNFLPRTNFYSVSIDIRLSIKKVSVILQKGGNEKCLKHAVENNVQDLLFCSLEQAN